MRTGHAYLSQREQRVVWAKKFREQIDGSAFETNDARVDQVGWREASQQFGKGIGPDGQ